MAYFTDVSKAVRMNHLNEHINYNNIAQWCEGVAGGVRAWLVWAAPPHSL